MGVRYAEVIGDPIAHSRSPLIQNFWLKKLALEGIYRATRVTPQTLDLYFAERKKDPDWRGCNVTMPLKTDVLSHAGVCDEVVQVVGSANCLLPTDEGLTAYNTDTAGLVEALGEGVLQKRPVVLLGSGGAARTALAVLRTQGLEEVAIIARDERKRASLAGRFGLRLVSPFEGGERGGTAQLLINATPLGMAGFDPMPQSMLDFVDLLCPEAVVFDMVYAPVETRLLSRARARGLRAIGGLDMLLGQADAAFHRFFGQRAPREHDAELRMLLIQ